MATKEVKANLHDGYIVDAEIEGFSYRMDYKERTPQGQETGTSPTGLLLAALAGCYLMTAKSFLDRHQLAVETLNVEIKGDFTKKSQQSHLNAMVTINLDTPLTNVKQLEMLDFINRYCTVSSVLKSGENSISAFVNII